MVTLDASELDGSITAYLDGFGTVDRYLTSTEAYLPYLGPSAAREVSREQGEVGQHALAAVLQQLSSRTPQLADGLQLYDRVKNTRILPCDCPSIDGLLGGGLRETLVTELAGETCSGKTQLCHLAAVVTAIRGERVMYFDTTNAFSAARAQQLVDSADPQVLDATLSNITVVRCHSIHALLSSLDELATQAPATWPKLVVVDSISAVLSPVIGALQHNQGHVLVAETVRLLRHTADALQCSVLVTNHVVGAGSRGDAAGSSSGALLAYKPALGEQWRGAAHVRLQLSRAGGDAVSATLLAHPMHPPGAQAWFNLGSNIR